jgi:cobalt/nickel transport system permease protein
MNAPAASAHHHAEGPYVDRVDPRVRIVAAVVLSIGISLSSSFAALAVALAAALLAVVMAGIPLGAALRRTAPVNLVMFILLCVLPWTTPGEPIGGIALPLSRDGLLLAVAVALKGNAIVLLLMALIGTMEPVTLGHALDHLRVPTKLAHLLLFTVRYIEVLRAEYLRLRAAMKVRGFRARMNRHTYRSLGHLAGMLLVRSLDRSDRVLAAMKCRGFRGHFHLLDHFSLTWADAPFAAAVALCLAAMFAAHWGLS